MGVICTCTYMQVVMKVDDLLSIIIIINKVSTNTCHTV